MRGGNIAELEMEGGPERERTVTQITSFQLFFEAVYPKPTISPMLPHYLSSLASLDKTNNQSLSWRKHTCSPPALLGPMEPQLPCDSVSEIPDVHSRRGSWGAASLSPPSLVKCPVEHVPSLTFCQAAAFPLKLKLYSHTMTPISRQDTSDLCTDLSKDHQASI